MNQYVVGRLEGILLQLVGAYKASGGFSSASKGEEREHFIDLFLSRVLPPVYRFGSGDATDTAGNKSGQLDVVVEYPLLPSLPAVGGGKLRMYLAESIASVVEVKSDIAGQWDGVLSTAAKLKPLRRDFGSYSSRFVGGSTFSRRKDGGITIQGGVFGPHTPGVEISNSGVKVGGSDMSPEEIPLFAVGYTGWKTIESLRERFADGGLSGILVIDSGLFVGQSLSGIYEAQGAAALWALICCLHDAASRLTTMSFDPIRYIHDPVQQS